MAAWLGWLVAASCLVGGLGASTGRQSKALGFLSTDADGGLLDSDIDPFEDQLQDNEDLSRARPDSPIYYIKLPAEPYSLVPGLGYVSRPPQLRPPPVVQPRPQAHIYRPPVRYVSNARPVAVYSWPQDSQINKLGPYQFNGKPSDVFLLHDAYNSIYDDPLQDFYP